jgi:hypothetical protein
MPWCGWTGTTPALWWLMPLLGLLFMSVMLFLCFRGGGCMPFRRRRSGERADLERDVQAMKEDIRKLLQQAR